MGGTCSALCRLWMIAQEVVAVYTAPPSNKKPICQRVPIAFAEVKYRKLLACMDSLHPDLTGGTKNSAHLALFQ